MLREHRITVCAAIVVLLSAGLAHAESEREQAAIRSADQWLTLLDRGEYAETWQRSASIFRDAITAEEWETAVTEARSPFGEFVSRKLLSASFQSSLPGAPDGEYVVLVYQAVYIDKAAAIETVTPTRENGVWKVAGYYIK